MFGIVTALHLLRMRAIDVYDSVVKQSVQKDR